MVSRFATWLGRLKLCALLLTTSAAASGIAILVMTPHKIISDRARKERITPLDPQNMLDKVMALPIHEWSYTGDRSHVRHVGPMAQDFAASFGLGDDDTHIHLVDSSGVALVAIQALAAKTQAQELELQALRREVASLHAQSSSASR